MSEQWFLKMDGIAGESKDRHHVDEIEVQSWGWGVSVELIHSLEGGVSAGPAQLSALTFAARSSLATLRLVDACAKGTRIATATLTGRRVGHATPVFLTVALHGVLVTSVQLAASGAQDCADQVVLHVEQVDATYATQDEAGGAGSQVVVHVDPFAT